MLRLFLRQHPKATNPSHLRPNCLHLLLFLPSRPSNQFHLHSDASNGTLVALKRVCIPLTPLPSPLPFSHLPPLPPPPSSFPNTPEIWPTLIIGCLRSLTTVQRHWARNWEIRELICFFPLIHFTRCGERRIPQPSTDLKEEKNK